MTQYKTMTAKLAVLGFAALLFLLGTNFFQGEAAPISKTIALVFATLILGAEFGIKRITGLKKDHDLMTVLGASIIGVLAIITTLSLTSWNVPAFIQGAGDFVVIIGSVWLAFDAFF